MPARYMLALFVLIFFFIARVNADEQDYLGSSAYAYNAKSTPLKKILDDFSDSFGLRLEYSVDDDEAQLLNGWIRANSASEFLNRISLRFKLEWFTFNEVLYISSSSDNVTKRIELEESSFSNARQALTGVGLVKSKFGWGELPSENAVLISGPKSYVNKLLELLSAKQKPENNFKSQVNDKAEVPRMMFFSLKYASVMDRQINVRGEELNIPGVASILQGLLEGTGGETSFALPNVNIPLSFNDKNIDDSSPYTNENISNEFTNIRIQADVRTNSILVYDIPSKKKFYNELISQLDIPQGLIEIDAIIVDIDRSHLKNLGVDWRSLNAGRELSVSSAGLGVSPEDQFTNGGATVFINDLDRFYASLRILEGEGEANVVANPSILTVENQPAVIDLSETAYIQTVGERVAELESITAGTLLRVTPRQIKNELIEQIQLSIDIEDGRVLEQDASGLPRVQRNLISTQAMIDENYSLVIGGYHRKSETKQLSKIPYLSSIPILGKIFTSTSSTSNHRERLFIITPKVSETRHKTSAYIESDLSSEVDFVENIVSERRKRVSDSIIDSVRFVFRHLAEGQLAPGYKLTDEMIKTSCDDEFADFDFSKGRRLLGRGLDIRVGIVTNSSSDLLELEESFCLAEDVVAVSFWDKHRVLSPGEKTQVFVAYNIRKRKNNLLPSLLNN